MIADCLGRRGHRTQKFHVGLRFRQPADQQLHGLDRREWAQDLAQHPHAAQLIWWQKEFVLTRARALNVDSRKNALIGKSPVEIDFHVAGALELFEDDVVHAAAGIDQAVAMMVSEPPSSTWRAAAKNRRGRCRALASIPPESTLPEGGVTAL